MVRWSTGDDGVMTIRRKWPLVHNLPHLPLQLPLFLLRRSLQL